jgi:hypothetical protein
MALETEHRQIEAESKSLAEQLNCNTDQQKGMILDLIFLRLNVVRHLSMMCSARDGARPFLGGCNATDCRKGGGRGEGRADH